MRLTVMTVLLGLFAAPVAQAQTAETRLANGSRFAGWTVTCEALAVNETACVLTQRLVREGGDLLLADLVAFPQPDGDGAYLAARVPNGVYLPHGFALRPAAETAEETRFVWQSCTPQLCEALVLLTVDELAALEAAGPEIVAGYRPALGASPLVFALDLTGIGEGVAALRAAGARQ